jgi:hypothetical protein
MWQMVDVRRFRITKVGQMPRRFGIGIALGAIAPLVTIADAIAQSSWQFNASTVQLEMVLDAGITPSYYLDSNPPRITIDLPNSDLAPTPVPQTYLGAVRRIQVVTTDSGARLILDLDPNLVLSPQHIQLQRFETPGGDYRWLLRPSLVNVASTPIPANPPPATAADSPPPSQRPTPVIQFGQPLPKSSVRDLP